MLGSLLKALRPSATAIEEEAVKEDETKLKEISLSIEEDFDITELSGLQWRLEFALRNDAAALRAPKIHGPDWDKLLTLDEARKYVDKWLEENDLDIGQSSSNLLSENRREPYSDYALKSCRIKGNRHIYGKLPFIERSKRSIFQLVLQEWLEEHVRPQAKPLKEVA